MGQVRWSVGRWPVVREFLQAEATAENISDEMFRLIENPDYRQHIKDDLLLVRKNLGTGDGSGKMARLVLSFLEQNQLSKTRV